MACTIAGDGGTYAGMAPAAEIVSYSFEVDGGLTPGFLYTDPGDIEADFAAVIAKSIESPESLTLTERIQLDGFYIGIVDQAYSATLHNFNFQPFLSLYSAFLSMKLSA